MVRGVLLFLSALCILSILPYQASSGDNASDIIATFSEGSVTALDLTVEIHPIPLEYRKKLLDKDPRGLRQDMLTRVGGNRLLADDAMEEADVESLTELPDMRGEDENRLVELIEYHLVTRPSIPDVTETRDYYEKHAEDWLGFEEVSLRHVFVRVNDASSEVEKEELAEKARAIHREIQSGEDMETVARKYAALGEGSYERGVILEHIPTHLMNQPLRDGIAHLQPGELSPPIRTPYGWEIVLLVDRKEAAPQPFADVRSSVKSRLQAERAETIRQTLQEKTIDPQVPVLISPQVERNEETGPDTPAYKIGDRVYTVEEINRERRSLARRLGKDAAAVPDADVIHRIQWIRWGEKSGFADIPVVSTDLRQTLERTVAENRMRAIVEEQLPEPSEQQLREFFKDNEEAFRIPEQTSGWLLTIHSGVNVLTTPPGRIYGMTQKMKDRQKEAREAMDDGLGFEEAVLLFSTDKDEIARKGYFPPAPSHGFIFDRLTEGLKPGEMSEWNVGKYVCYRAKLEKRIPSHIPSFAEARDEVREAWEKDFRERTREKTVKEAMEKRSFTTDWNTLMNWDPLTPLPEVHL